MATLLRWMVIVGLVMVCSSVAGMVTGGLRTPAGLRWRTVTTPALPDSPLSPRASRERGYGSVSDLYGNRISPAVATYGIDAFGGAVEQHFPDLRISRLGSPEG